MKRIYWSTMAVAGAVATLATTGGAQRTPEPTAPNFTKLVTLDSGWVNWAAISPNGKWVVYQSGAGQIWMAPTDRHEKPFRLLEGNHRDRQPFWFTTSDGLTFSSNRPSRSDPNAFYGMTVAINPETGRAAGPPRAITTEPVKVMGYPSPDGKWAAYATLSDSVKVVPITGGTARPVASAPGVNTVMWYVDGKALVFNEGKGNWFRVSANGGTPVHVQHAPYFGRLHLHGDDAPVITHLELRDSTERVVSATDIPRGVTPRLFNYTNAAVGIITQQSSRTDVYSVNDGRVQEFADSAWGGGWARNGQAFVGVMSVGPANFAALYDRTGRIIKRVQFPADVAVNDLDRALGSAVLFRRGAAPKAGEDFARPLYVADIETGSTRLLVPRSYWAGRLSMNHPVDLTGPGGEEVIDLQTGAFLTLVPSGGGFAAARVKPDGKSTTLRAFRLADSVIAVGVVGDRVAWAREEGDSTVVYAAQGLAGVPHRLLAKRRTRDMELAWARSGAALAVNDLSSPITVIPTRDDGAPAAAPRTLPVKGTDIWSLRWADDDRLILAWTKLGGQNENQSLMVVSADGSNVRTLDGSNFGDDYMFVSPDGKQVMFPHEVSAGSSFWRIDFVPVKR